jgi:hypothetical protein
MTTDPPFGPLADIGVPNPFFYHRDFDDFDYLDTQKWIVTSLSTGSVLGEVGDGGLIIFTTAATSGDTEVMQHPFANFSLPQGATLGKRAAFLVRLQMSDITNSDILVGLCDKTTTPFSAITDGLYYEKVSGGTVLNLNSVVGSTATTLAINTAAYSLVNATNIDLAWLVTRKGDVVAYVGSQLVGWIPQSGTGALNTSNYPALPVVGPTGRITAPTLTTANLTLTMAIKATAAAVKTLTVDFIGAWKER